MQTTECELVKVGWQFLSDIITVEEANGVRDIDFAAVKDTRPVYDTERGFCYTYYAPESTLFILKRLQPILENIIGEELIPTYWYSTIYFNHSYMKKHKDRNACEISVSLNIESNDDWGLQFIDFNNNKGNCFTSIGQAVVYLGPEVEHWRDPLVSGNEDTRYMQAFFHYVRKNGKYSDYAYDKDGPLGEYGHQKVLRLLGQ